MSVTAIEEDTNMGVEVHEAKRRLPNYSVDEMEEPNENNHGFCQYSAKKIESHPLPQHYNSEIELLWEQLNRYYPERDYPYSPLNVEFRVLLKNGMQSYEDENISLKLYICFLLNKHTVDIVINGVEYLIDFKEFVQINKATNFRRHIVFGPKGGYAHEALPPEQSWVFADDNKKYSYFDAETTWQLTHWPRTRPKNYIVPIGFFNYRRNYIIILGPKGNQGLQINTTTLNKRPIFRVDRFHEHKREMELSKRNLSSLLPGAAACALPTASMSHPLPMTSNAASAFEDNKNLIRTNSVDSNNSFVPSAGILSVAAVSAPYNNNNSNNNNNNSAAAAAAAAAAAPVPAAAAAPVVTTGSYNSNNDNSDTNNNSSADPTVHRPVVQSVRTRLEFVEQAPDYNIHHLPVTNEDKLERPQWVLNRFEIPFVPADNNEPAVCAICLEDVSSDVLTVDGIKKNSIRLTKCHNHFYHDVCILGCLNEGSITCPTCNQSYGCPRTGNQPKGTMRIFRIPNKLPSFTCKTLAIEYSFPGGTQDETHPYPGQPFSGNTRVAYLPDNEEGRKMLGLLKVAWHRRLLFTVDYSVTLGREAGVQVVWNGIHHKTAPTGPYGYPDPDYPRRLREELAIVGVTDADVE